MSTVPMQPPTTDAVKEEALTPFTRKWSRRLLYLSFLNFIIAGVLALFMRTDQAGSSSILGPALGSPQVFGQLLLAHGLGMFIGWQFPFTYGLIAYAIPKYMKRKLFSERLLPVVFFLFAIGFYLVWASAATGFGPGWYFLFPLPFHGGPPGLSPWGPTQDLMFFAGMIITNVSLFVFTYIVLGTVFSNKYQDEYNTKPGFNHSMSAKFAASIGFDAYMPKAVRSRIFGYPPAVIAAVVTTLDMLVSAPPFLTLLGDGAWVSMNNPSFLNNLVAKNFLWINYHPIVYYAFFPLIGMYYTLIPILAKRNFSSSRWAKAPWPLLLITGVGVYSHHIFIDTSQPYILQFMSQQMSMIIGIASGISVFTLIALIWRSKYEWNLTAKFIVASIFGWVIGGIGGVEQGNIALDEYLHNTYAVVGHFHFNGLDGIVFAGFGVLYWILPEISSKQWYSKSLGEIHFWGSVVGGFGLAFTFTAMGYLGVARREYLPVNTGLPFTVTLDYQTWLVIAFFFAIVVAAAQIPFIWNLLKTLTGPTMQKPVTTPSSLEDTIAIPVPTPMVHSVDSKQNIDGENLAGMGGAPPSVSLGSTINQVPKRIEEV
ncbi:MAG: cbb3-type cytochrome c oxidase subunit I [Thaumarchaeota archaeon]|nr:cbb3-type cytochrome c oxidase subunit I [Nitrososphaerota archaeon]